MTLARANYSHFAAVTTTANMTTNITTTTTTKQLQKNYTNSNYNHT